jgi:hypothetical protein
MKALVIMPDDQDAFILITDGLNETQDSLVREMFKEHAESWWHEMPGVWLIIGGGDVSIWRDRLLLLTSLPKSTFLFLELPRLGSRRWSGRQSSKSLEWIYQNYATANGKRKKESAVEPTKDPWGSVQPSLGGGFADEPPF